MRSKKSTYIFLIIIVPVVGVLIAASLVLLGLGGEAAAEQEAEPTKVTSVVEVEIAQLRAEIAELKVNQLTPNAQTEIRHGAPLHRYLTTSGITTGLRIATDTYTINVQFFSIAPPPDTTFILNELIVTIECEGDVISSFYCDMPPLENGITFGIRTDQGPLPPLNDELLIKDNADWARVCFNIFFEEMGAPGGPLADNNFVRVLCKFGSPIILNGARGERFEVKLNDDFTPLANQTFFVIGSVL